MQIFAASYLLPVSSPPLAGGAIVVDKGLIVAAGTLADLRKTCDASVREFPGCTIMPGLVNAHTHLELTHFPSWKLRKGIDYTPRTYVDWVVQVIKIRRTLSRSELVNSVREGINKSLECGTTAVGDILTDRTLLPLFEDAPLSGRLYCEAIGHDPVQCEAVLRSIEETVASFKPGRLLPGISPHAPHTLSPAFMCDVAGFAGSHSLPTAIHLAESREEATFFHDSTGRFTDELFPFAGWEGHVPPPRRTTPTAYLDALGMLTPATTAIHCVQVTPADAEILRQRGVTAVLCPRSNDRLVVGRAPAALLKKAGIPLALGTDSLASNDSLSLWDEMRFFRRRFPGLFTPAEVLEMATLGAARAIHLQHLVGSLEKGKRADFLVMKSANVSSGAELPEMLIEKAQIEEIFVGGELLTYT